MYERGEEGRDWGEEVAEEVWMEIVRRLLPHPLPSPAHLPFVPILATPHDSAEEEMKIGVTHEEGRALIRDITSLSFVSRRFHRLIKDDKLWRDIFHFAFGISSPRSRVVREGWCKRTVQRAGLERLWRSIDNSYSFTSIVEDAVLLFAVHWSDDLAVAGGFGIGYEMFIVRNPWDPDRREVTIIEDDEDIDWTQSMLFDDEGTIWSAHEPNQISVWNAETAKRLSIFSAHDCRVKKLKLDSKRERLFSCSWDSTIKIWNSKLPSPDRPLTCLSTLGTTMTRTKRELKPDGPHVGYCEDIDVVDTVIASVSADASVKIWDWPSEKCVRTCLGHEGWSVSVNVNKSNENLVVSGDDRGVVKLWDSRMTSSLIGDLDTKGLTIAQEYGDAVANAHRDWVWTVQMDECKVVIGLANGFVHVIDLRTFKRRASFEPAKQAGASPPEGFPHQVRVRQLQFSDERMMVASDLGLFAIDLSAS